MACGNLSFDENPLLVSPLLRNFIMKEKFANFVAAFW